jgi:surfactin synthase thioesterase subunit
MQLFCLPYAGGSALVYARWRRILPSWINVQPVELPGRGTRMDEPLHVEPRRLAEQLAAELLHAPLDRGYGLFGHSLGALIAFEVIHVLLARGAPAPTIMFASGTEAPSVRDGSKWRLPLNDEALRDELRSLRGTPAEALDDPEIMRDALPVLRADFLMCGAYEYRRRQPLPCPIQVFGGVDDDVDREALEAWQCETSASFDIDMLPGHHFFIHSHQTELLSLIVSALARRSERPPRSFARASGKA